MSPHCPKLLLCDLAQEKEVLCICGWNCSSPTPIDVFCSMARAVAPMSTEQLANSARPLTRSKCTRRAVAGLCAEAAECPDVCCTEPHKIAIDAETHNASSGLWSM